MARRRRPKQTQSAIGCLIVLALVVGALGSVVDAVKPMLPSTDVVIGATMFAIAVVTSVVFVRGIATLLRRRREVAEIEADRESERIRIASAVEQRRQALIAKYQDEAVVAAIMAGRLWRGMSKEQLIETWGKPLAIGTEVSKARTRETYKYNQTAVNRFARNAILENDKVVGWKE